MRYLLLLLPLLWTMHSLAQEDTTFSRVYILDIENDTVAPLDSNFNWPQNFLNRKDLIAQYIHGNNGSYIPITAGMENQWSQFTPSNFNPIPLERKVYITQVPYTRINGLLGSQAEEYLNFIHTQNPSPNWNIGLEHKFYKDQGTYNYSTVRTWNTRVYSYYQNKKRNYLLYTRFNANKGEMLENFGIDPLEYIDILGYTTPKLLLTRSNSAKHTFKNNSVQVKQIVPLVNASDSTIGINWIVDASALRGSRYFEDDNSALYDSLFPQSIQYGPVIADTLMNHEVHIPSMLSFQMKNLELAGGYQFDKQWIKHQWTDSLRDNYQWMQGSLIEKLDWKSNRLKLQHRGQYYVSGYNQNNYNHTTQLDYRLKKGAAFIKFTDKQEQMHPIWENYHAQFVEINATSDVIKHRIIQGGFSNQWLEIGIANFQYKGWYQFTDSTLTYDNNPFSTSQFKAGFKLNKKHFGFKQVVYHQLASSSKLTLPQWISQTHIYTKGAVFKQKLKFQFGIKALYYSSFNSPNYLPFFAAITYTGNESFGNYPIIDTYLNMKVNHAIIYLQSTHVNHDLMGFNYQLTDGYHLAGRMIKAGIVVDLAY